MNLSEMYATRGLKGTLAFLWSQICGLKSSLATTQASTPLFKTFTGTGDGATLVFTTPLGLTAAPTYLSVVGNNALTNSHPFTASATAATLTITYTTAPAAGPLQWTAIYH